MKDVGTRCTGRHNVNEFAQVDPAFVPEWLGLRMLLDIVIPVPSTDCLDGNNGAVDFTELKARLLVDK